MPHSDTPVELVQAVLKSFSLGVTAPVGKRGRFADLLEEGSVTQDKAAEMLAGRYGLELSAAFRFAPCLAACSLWNKEKRIYWFQNDLAQILTGQADTLTPSDHLPLEALRELPGSCFYIKAPDAIAEGIDGCFLWLEKKAEKEVLRFLFLMANMRNFLPGSIVLGTDDSVMECLPNHEDLAYANLMAAAKGDQAALAVALDQIRADLPFRSVFHNLVLRALQMALYLVTDNAEVSDGPPEGHAPGAEPKEEGIVSYTVGAGISERLRKADSGPREEGGNGKQRRAHMRKGHWHRYWKGPKNGERQLVVHWVEPTIVGARGDEIKAVSITKVT